MMWLLSRFYQLAQNMNNTVCQNKNQLLSNYKKIKLWQN